MRVQVLACVSGFTADFEAWLQLQDLRRFQHALEAMHSALSGEAVLDCAEPGIRIVLAMASAGQIVGKYVFRNQEDLNSKLSGEFEADQSYLPALATSVEELIAALAVPGVA